MAINRSRVGAGYPAPTMTVTPEAIAAYAEATVDRLDVYHAGANSLAPPVFAIVPGWPAVRAVLEDETLGLDAGRIVHGGQRMRFHRPIRAGDVLSTTGRLASVEDRGTNEAFVISLVTVDGTGEAVCDQEVVCVSRGTAESAEGSARAAGLAVRGPQPPGGLPSPAQEAPPPDLERTVDLPADVTYRYAEASGDRNQIHLDPDFARRAGLPGIVVHGLCLLAIALQGIVGEVAGGDPGRVRSLEVRFVRPIEPGNPFTTSIWRTSEGARFASLDRDRNVLLKDGRVELT